MNLWRTFDCFFFLYVGRIGYIHLQVNAAYCVMERTVTTLNIWEFFSFIYTMDIQEEQWKQDKFTLTYDYSWEIKIPRSNVITRGELEFFFNALFQERLTIMRTIKTFRTSYGLSSYLLMLILEIPDSVLKVTIQNLYQKHSDEAKTIWRASQRSYSLFLALALLR